MPAARKQVSKSDFSEDSDNFDDFAGVRGAPQPGAFPDFDDDDDDDDDGEEDDIARRLGWGGDETPRDQAPVWKGFTKYYMFAGAGAVVILVVVAVIMLLQSDPPELSTTPRMPHVAGGSAAPTAPTAKVDLQEPAIHGDKVVLTWTSNPETLDFFVVVIRPNLPTQTINAHRGHTLTYPVEPVGAYCFQVQASNSVPGQPVSPSQTRPIRGSDCRH